MYIRNMDKTTDYQNGSKVCYILDFIFVIVQRFFKIASTMGIYTLQEI